MGNPRDDCGALVLAAGSGTRLGTPKQFLELSPGTRLVDRAIETCRQAAGFVAVVIPPDVSWAGPEVDAVVVGGASRIASVAAGLAVLPSNAAIVLIHDAAHPVASADLALAVRDAVAAGAAGAVPVLDAVDVVKRRLDDGSLTTVGRDRLGSAQVPMAFARAALERAHVSDAGSALEDSDLVEQVGERVIGITGEAANIHVVDAETLRLARHIAAL